LSRRPIAPLTSSPVSSTPSRCTLTRASRGPRVSLTRFEITLDDSGHPNQDLPLRDVRPGDDVMVLPLPDTASGYANGAFAPASRRPVDDIAADIRAATDATVSPVAVRLTDEALNAAGLGRQADPAPSATLRRRRRKRRP
jgi:hypothetical protein